MTVINSKANPSAATDHGSLGGLVDDDHDQYPLLAGRSGGQTLIGGSDSGDDLTLQSTSNATRGSILLGSSAYDEVNNRLGVGVTAPGTLIHARATTATAVIRLERDQASITSSDLLARIEVETNDTTDPGICASIAALAYDSSCATGWRFQTGTPSALVEIMQMDPYGYVGIGLPWPDGPDTVLHIQHATDPYFRFTRDDTTVVADEIIGKIEFETKDSTAPGVAAYIKGVAEGSDGEVGLAFGTGTGSTTERVRILNDGGVLLKNLKTGATQGAAGAAADELWTTNSHASLPDNVVMIGV